MVELYFFLANSLIIFSSLAPIFGLLFEKLAIFNNKISFILVQSFLIVVCLAIYFLPIHNDTDLIMDYGHQVAVVYTLMVLGFNFIFTKLWGIRNFAYVFCMSLGLTYLATESHEVASFIQQYLSLSLFTPFRPLNDAYTLVVGYIWFKKAKLSMFHSLILVWLLVSSSFMFMDTVWVRVLHFELFALIFGLCSRWKPSE